MITDQVPKADVRYTESPASWNVRYATTSGFVCMLTLRRETQQDGGSMQQHAQAGPKNGEGSSHQTVPKPTCNGGTGNSSHLPKMEKESGDYCRR